jgi:WD40 repeat protein
VARLGNLRFVHTEQIQTVQFTPDGSAIFAHDTEGAVLWDVASGEKLRTFRPPGSKSCMAAALSGDGRRVVLAEKGSSISVLDAKTGKRLRTFRAGFARSIAVNQDGSKIAVGGSDVTLWWASGKRIRRWSRPGGSVPALAWSRDEKLIACSGAYLAEMVVHRSDGKGKPVRLDGAGGFSQGLGFSPDERHVAGSCEVEIGKKRHASSLRIWDATTGEIVHKIGGSFNCVQYSADGSILAAGALATVKIFDAKTAEQLHQLPNLSGHINALAFSNDGRLLATAHEKRIRIWKTDTWEEVDPGTGHGEPVHVVAFSPNGKVIATAGHDRSVILWSWPDGKELHQVEDLGLTNGMHHLTFSPDSSRVVAAGWPHKKDAFLVFDVKGGQLVSKFGKDRPGGVAHFLSNEQLITSGPKGSMSIWTVGGRFLRSVGALEKGPVRQIALNPDATAVWWIGDEQQMGLRDLATGEDIRLLEGGDHHGSDYLRMSPDREWLAVGSRVWEIESGDLIEKNARSLPNAISPGGRLLAFTGNKAIALL